MARIYISSTFEDLKNERRRVSEAILAMGHQPVRMETFTASDQPPLEHLLQELRSCQVYVGIFAFRYGYIPPNQTKSITALEYEEAGKIGLPRLTFLLDEKANWRADRINKDDFRRITEFRKELVSSQVCGFFSTPDDLVAQVVHNLARTIDAVVGEENGSQAGPVPAAAPSSMGLSFSIDKLSSNTRNAISRAEQFRRSKARDEIRLEKFIQLPFRVPAPLPEDFGQFLWPDAPPLPVLSTDISSEPQETGAGLSSTSDSTPQSTENPTTPEGRAPEADAAMQHERTERARIQFGRDSDAVRRAALMVAPVLDYNPRRIKQFVNLFRLKAYIANQVGLLDEQVGPPLLTLEQLAKFVAAVLVWPGMLSALDERPSLLERLEGMADGKLEQKDLDYIETCWWEEPRLQSLLRYGLTDESGQPRSEGWRYSFAKVPMEKLLRVSPVVPQSAGSPPLPPQK